MKKGFTPLEINNVSREQQNKQDKSLTGFTLVEALISIFLFSLLLLVAANLLLSLFKNPKQNILAMENIDQARTVADDFANEIRNLDSGNDGSFALAQAGNSQIIFYTHYRAAAGLVNRVRYYISGNTLYRGIVVPSGTPLSYNLSSEVVRPVQTAITNGSSPAFYYYNGNYSGAEAALAQPVNVNQVKFIKINLIVKNLVTTNSTGSFLITGGSAVRNLKTNLGN